MPPIEFASEEINVGSKGRVLLFPSCELEYLDRSDPYFFSLEQLALVGLHRNVFLVDAAGIPLWQIGDYEQNLPDMVISVELTDDSDACLATSFHGSIMRINLADGEVTKMGWTKT